MPVSLTYPGVYIEEIPSGVRAITGVATSITAFLGRTPSGPVDAPVTVTSLGEFQRLFGALNPSYQVGYSVKDFFLNGGSQAVIVRRYVDGALEAAQATAKAAQDSTATVPATVAAAARTEANKYTEDPAKSATAAVATAAETAATAAAATAKAATDSTATAATAVAAAARTAANTFTTEPAKTAAAAVATAAEAAAAANGATTATVKTAAVAASVPAVKAAAANAIAAGDNRATFTLTTNKLTLKANSPGTWGNKLSVKFDYEGIDDDVAKRYGLAAAADLFNLTVILNPPNGPSERIRNVTVKTADNARAIDRVLAQESNWLLAVVDRSGTTDPTRPTATPPTQDPTDPANFQGTSAVVFFKDGRDSAKLTTSAHYLGSAAGKTGLYALDDVDLFNLLCIPPDNRTGDTPSGVHADALAYCVKRRAMYLVDPPRAWSANRATAVAAAKTGLTGLGITGPSARNAALYFPRVMLPDPMREDQLDSFPASGMLAGVMARTDVERGVWKAPAGVDAALAGVTQPEINLTDAENGLLNPLGINCLRSFPIYGAVVWGARTMRGADQLGDEYKYVPVRRLALFIEESLFRGLKWVVFEPNDEPLWALIRLNVGTFMQNLFRQGAFQGGSPREAFFVKCDHETTLPADVNLGVVNIVVGFAPLKPAEFVVLKLQQIAGQGQ